MRLFLLLTLSCLMFPCSAQAHTGADGGLHHTLPLFLAWLPFARAMYQAGWRTCAKALYNWLTGGA